MECELWIIENKGMPSEHIGYIVYDNDKIYYYNLNKELIKIKAQQWLTNKPFYVIIISSKERDQESITVKNMITNYINWWKNYPRAIAIISLVLGTIGGALFAPLWWFVITALTITIILMKKEGMMEDEQHNCLPLY